MVNIEEPDETRESLARYFLKGSYERIYFVHPRKTGGTSLNYMFYSISGGDPEAIYHKLRSTPQRSLRYKDFVYVAGNEELINRGRYFYASSHIPLHRLRLPKNTFVVTILRDPVARIVSHYRMLLHYTLNKIWRPFMEVESSWLGSSLIDFINNIPRERLQNQLYMFSSNLEVDEALDKIMSCDHFLFLEEFTPGTSELSRKLALPLSTMHIRKNPLTIFPTEEDLIHIRSRLEHEYELLSRLRALNLSSFPYFELNVEPPLPQTNSQPVLRHL